MAVRIMVHFDSDSDALASGRCIEIVRDHYLHREGVHHSPYCDCFKAGHYDGQDREKSKGCLPECRLVGPLYMETRFRGLVLDVGEHNYHEDSDFFAIVWDAEKGEPREVEYGTTRAWTYPNSAEVDATPEIRALYNAWREVKAIEERKAEDVKQAKTVQIGRRVRVVSGKWAGREGFVFYREERKSKFGTWSYGVRLGVSPSNVRHSDGYPDAIWVDEKNVEVEWQRYLKDACNAELLLESVGG
jgi:hypothetical protein